MVLEPKKTKGKTRKNDRETKGKPDKNDGETRIDARGKPDKNDRETKRNPGKPGKGKTKGKPPQRAK